MVLDKIYAGEKKKAKTDKEREMVKGKISKFSQQERGTIKELYEIARIKKYKLMLSFLSSFVNPICIKMNYFRAVLLLVYYQINNNQTTTFM